METILQVHVRLENSIPTGGRYLLCHALHQAKCLVISGESSIGLNLNHLLFRIWQYLCMPPFYSVTEFSILSPLNRLSNEKLHDVDFTKKGIFSDVAHCPLGGYFNQLNCRI